MIAEDISWDVDSRRSLARLARTSKGFSEDALNALWFELQDLLPVILLLPSDAIEVSWEYGIREVVSGTLVQICGV